MTSLVIVYRPRGKHAFASMTFPGLLGCMTGMNDAGLVVAGCTVHFAADGSPRLDQGGMPMWMCLRLLLEECATVAEAEQRLRCLKRSTYMSVGTCDRRGSAVIEVTPRSVYRRGAQRGISACTNHFRTWRLTTQLASFRYDLLARRCPARRLDVRDVRARLDAAAQGCWTIQTMVFQPAVQEVQLAFGPGPATALPVQTLPLAPLFAPAATSPHGRPLRRAAGPSLPSPRP
jgi:hypothetical protein